MASILFCSSLKIYPAGLLGHRQTPIPKPCAWELGVEFSFGLGFKFYSGLNHSEWVFGITVQGFREDY